MFKPTLSPFRMTRTTRQRSERSDHSHGIITSNLRMHSLAHVCFIKRQHLLGPCLSVDPSHRETIGRESNQLNTSLNNILRQNAPHRHRFRRYHTIGLCLGSRDVHLRRPCQSVEPVTLRQSRVANSESQTDGDYYCAHNVKNCLTKKIADLPPPTHNVNCDSCSLVCKHFFHRSY